MKLTLALGLASVASCGNRHTDPVEGTWVTSLQTRDCALQYTFRNGAVEQDRRCTLPDGQLAVEVTAGTYVVSGKTLVLTSTRSSCPDDLSQEVTYSFSRQGTSLTRISSEGSLVLQNSPAPESHGAAAVGCFDEDFKFVAAPIVALH